MEEEKNECWRLNLEALQEKQRNIHDGRDNHR